jgi:toxin ParE1/3/4
MKPVLWRPQAKRDAAGAAAWYATQGGLELELAFIDALQNAEAQLAQFPATGSTRHSQPIADAPAPLRFLPLRRFDRYLVYYLDLPEHVEVVRIWHASRGLEALMAEQE